MKLLCIILMLTVLVDCSSKQPTQQAAGEPVHPATQITAIAVAPEPKSAASRADFAKNWYSSDSTKEWAARGITVATGNPENDLLIVYFSKVNADIAAQMMSPSSTSAEFSQVIAHAGFKNVMGLHLTPGQKPGPSVTENQIMYTGVVSQDSVKWSSAQARDAASAGAKVQAFSIDGLYPGMSWQEARATSSFKEATCTNGGGNTASEHLETKSCRIDHGNPGGDTQDTANTYLMFYRNRLYLIVSSYQFDKNKKALERAFGHPKRSPSFDETLCWYRGGVSYQVPDPDNAGAPQITVVDFNFAPRSVQTQRSADPTCRGM